MLKKSIKARITKQKLVISNKDLSSLVKVVGDTLKNHIL